MTAQDDWQCWCDRFDKTHNDVIRLFHNRAIWRTILAMLDANPKVARSGFGEYWLESCYTDSMLISICEATGSRSAPFAAILLASLRGNQAEAIPLVEATIAEATAGGRESR